MAQPRYTRPQLIALALADARKYGVDPQIFERQINQESGFNPDARSGAGALGIAQFMPGTAAGYHINPLDPAQALDAAARYDASELKAFHGDYREALAAYNAGAGNADKWNDPSFAGGQTYRYVRDILAGTNPATTASTSNRTVAGATDVPVRGTPTVQSTLTATPQQPTNAIPSLLASLASSDGDYTAFYQQLGQALRARNTTVPTPGPAAASGATAPTAAPTVTYTPSRVAGGFLTTGASYKPGRLDQGHDFQTDPGTPIVAPGAGVVVAVKSDPGGFGPSYPVVRFTSGPYRGKTVYIGHTLAAVKPGQSFTAGAVLSHTGTAPVGNASVPGWAEIGYATPAGLPGAFGQTTPF